MTTINNAVQAYLTDRKSELSTSSIQNHRYQLKQWRRWAGGPGEIDCVEDVEPIDLSKFRRARSRSINSNTMYNQLCVLRLHLRFCHRMGWLREEIPESIVLPSRDGRARDRAIDADRAGAILDDLERYQYASRDHVIWTLLWTTGCRTGGLLAQDTGDVHLDERWTDIVHRPGTGTPLKNKADGEREVNLHGWVCEVLRAWIKDRRPDRTDSHGRSPLIPGEVGRYSRSSVRRSVYKLTACGGIDEGCECDAGCASKCPASVSPHDIRRSSITAWLDQGHDPAMLEGRFDLSKKTMDRHYDVRTPSQKRELRRDVFDM
jgi:integrase